MKYVLGCALLALAATNSFAQTTPANKDAKTPAVATSDTVNPGAPVAGRNSFTEAQARSRIEAAGFTNVSDLAKDSDGVWRGKAAKSGKTTTVSLDYQGNVTTN
jgi:hypothetical protein